MLQFAAAQLSQHAAGSTSLRHLAAAINRVASSHFSTSTAASSAAPANAMQLIKELRAQSGAPIQDVKVWDCYCCCWLHCLHYCWLVNPLSDWSTHNLICTSEFFPGCQRSPRLHRVQPSPPDKHQHTLHSNFPYSALVVAPPPPTHTHTSPLAPRTPSILG
jgi:hypothetical protein